MFPKPGKRAASYHEDEGATRCLQQQFWGSLLARWMPERQSQGRESKALFQEGIWYFLFLICISLIFPMGWHCYTAVWTAQKDVEVPGQEMISSNNNALLPATRQITAVSYCHKGNNIYSQNSTLEDVLVSTMESGLDFLEMKSLFPLWLNSWCESMLCWRTVLLITDPETQAKRNASKELLVWQALGPQHMGKPHSDTDLIPAAHGLVWRY